MNKISNPRELAMLTIKKVLQEKSYSNIQLNQTFKTSDLDQRDQGFVTQIVYGTIQQKLFLEYQIADLLKTEPKNQFVRPILLISVYQMFFLDKVPTHAIIDEANKLAKKYTNGNLYKLINGILRNIDRRGLVLPNKNDPDYLVIKESMPEWLVEYFIERFGLDKTESMLTSFNGVPHNSVRVNKEKIPVEAAKKQLEDAGFKVEISPLNPHNLILDHGHIYQTDLFKQGLITIQDEAASSVVDFLQVNQDDLVLDACAAPGGKTIQIAEQLGDHGKVVALDLHAKKLALIKENAMRMEVADKITTEAMDARNADQILTEKFDKILVDAPCSGLGLMRRKPEIRYEKHFSDLKNLQKVQSEILASVKDLLKPDGRLVYSTCTISLEENEQVIDNFLQENDDFYLEEISFANYQTQPGIRIFPDDYQTDGFYITSLRRRG